MQKKLPFLLALACFLLFTAEGFSQSEKQKELEAQRQALLQEIKQINSLLFKTRGEKKSVLTQVEDLDQRIATTENLIKITNRQANLLTREINDNLSKIDNLRSELTALKEDYAAMIKKSYKSKSEQSRVMFLLSSESFLQAYKRLQYMKQYTKFRKQQGESIKEKTELLKILNTDLLSQKEKKNQLIAENKKTKAQLTKERRNQQQLIASLKKDEGTFAKQIRAKQKAADAIDRKIEKIIADAIAASNKAAGNETVTGNTVTKRNSTFAMNAEAKTLAANFTSNKGKLPWPINKGGIVVKRYGKQQHPQLPNVTTFNSGVEIATEDGAKARAVFNGTVLSIIQIPGANKVVMVQHGNYISAYKNLTDILVQKGDKVTTKQELGTVYKNPTLGKTILKFAIYQNSKRLNPADWIYRM
ncbi:murein hydrolase activator EnvC family protein [Marinirhabdus gelatinilytica]|uniref:Septal ring factor EnvC (AmiA/AmiB activator) n=1 Tax=Marinirhabdus gelatinilytica TaxID=1703343 RepID=A0A370QJK5_9FLAO|nr:peptidoglycan DD-metalloendopeptidase family protein [Marinirhabdus gelatinilytica]RDK88557.1 septal ring factor EnvC (AmiA/AmiB activator) [Marinirhabdus gelatinilytica]